MYDFLSSSLQHICKGCELLYVLVYLICTCEKLLAGKESLINISGRRKCGKKVRKKARERKKMRDV